MCTTCTIFSESKRKIRYQGFSGSGASQVVDGCRAGPQGLTEMVSACPPAMVIPVCDSHSQIRLIASR